MRELRGGEGEGARGGKNAAKEDRVEDGGI